MLLEVPALPLVVDARVFDAWAWCTSEVIEWKLPSDAALAIDGARIDGDNPPNLAFVVRDGADVAFLPRELAHLHVSGYGLADEHALAPYAIDDATDLLFEHRRRPHDVFWLAASTLPALVWGLHDWVHFHNHGPFTEPALTELQCDLVALAWLRRNAERIGLRPETVASVAGDLARLSRRRFEEEKVPSPVADLDGLFAGPYPARPLLHAGP